MTLAALHFVFDDPTRAPVRMVCPEIADDMERRGIAGHVVAQSSEAGALSHVRTVGASSRSADAAVVELGRVFAHRAAQAKARRDAFKARRAAQRDARKRAPERERDAVRSFEFRPRDVARFRVDWSA